MISPQVTVVVLAHGHAELLDKSLKALSEQSLRPDSFDVLVLIDHDGGESCDLVRNVQHNTGTLPIQFLAMDGRSRGIFWSEAIEKISGRYMTFLHEGDRLSSGFLEDLLRAADEGTVPIAQIVQSSVTKTPEYASLYNRTVLRMGASPFTKPCEHMEFFAEIVGKLIPTNWLNETLILHAAAGEPLLFNVTLALKRDFVFSKFPASVGAAYHYSKLNCQHALCGAGQNVDFLNILAKLKKLHQEADEESKKQLISTALIWQMHATRRYLDTKSYESIVRDVSESGLLEVDREVLDESVATLGIVANFAPYAGTAGIVAAKRIIDNDKPIDLISSVIASRKRQEEDLRLTNLYIREHEILAPGIQGTDDADIKNFIDFGLKTLERWLTRGARYDEMYSRAMVPHSHFLAAAIKRSNPGITWVAEFSDPLSLTVDGRRRRAAFQFSEVHAIFSGWGTFEQQAMLLEESSIFRWAELLAYFFADRLIFTNENQLAIMLEYAPPAYRHAIEEKAIVSHHPTLPEKFYGMVTPEWKVDQNQVTLAYFGDFHSTRGMTEVIDALENLPDDELYRFNLVIFTDSKRGSIHSQFSERVSEIITVQPRVNYLEFLATLGRMNVLIVNDSHTTDYYSQNPYLPSKVSDYRGSTTPIWAVVEPNSVLSKMEFSYKSTLGDISEASGILKAILRDELWKLERNNS